MTLAVSGDIVNRPVRPVKDIANGYCDEIEAVPFLRKICELDKEAGVQRISCLFQIIQTFPQGTEITFTHHPANNWGETETDEGMVIGLRNTVNLGVVLGIGMQGNRCIKEIAIDPFAYDSDELFVEKTEGELVLSKKSGPPPHDAVVRIKRK